MRKVLFQIHLWVGLILGIVFVLLGLSGSLLVYDDAILGLGEKPAPLAQEKGTPLPLDTLLESARAAIPENRASATLQLPRETGTALLVRFQRAGRDGPQQAREVYVDPVNGRVLETRKAAFSPFFSFLHRFHGNLALGPEGRQIVGWLGVGMMVLGISGIVLWWPTRGAWKRAFGVRKNARGYWFHRELHGALGIWSWVVFVIVSFSGVVIVFPETTRAVITLGRPAATVDLRRGPVVMPVAGAKPLGADGALSLVRARYPGADVRSIAISQRRSEAIRVMLGSIDEGPVSVAFVDPWKKAVVAVRNPPGSASDAFVAWQRPLHAGNGWGAVWRALVFLSGLMPSVFFITGVVMWLKKRRARVAQSAAVLEGASP